MQVCFTKRIVESHFVPISLKNENFWAHTSRIPQKHYENRGKRIGFFLKNPEMKKKLPNSSVRRVKTLQFCSSFVNKFCSFYPEEESLRFQNSQWAKCIKYDIARTNCKDNRCTEMSKNAILGELDHRRGRQIAGLLPITPDFLPCT